LKIGPVLPRYLAADVLRLPLPVAANIAYFSVAETFSRVLSCRGESDTLDKNVTFLEVLDDAVKIGIGGFTGWLIARGTRSHEFEKERRRRKQDCLERVIEDLDEQQSTFDALCVTSLALRNLREKKGDPTLEQALLKDVNQANKESEVARTKFIRSRSKLIVFGFEKCADSLKAYNSKLLNFRVSLGAVRDGKQELEVYASGRTELAKLVVSFRAEVTKAFATL
jgi:hypothetical protein